tara:strand:- start:524 stop:1495 length:972 start_codon:yes stop_codon:yes gene_type:complete
MIESIILFVVIIIVIVGMAIAGYYYLEDNNNELKKEIKTDVKTDLDTVEKKVADTTQGLEEKDNQFKETIDKNVGDLQKIKDGIVLSGAVLSHLYENGNGDDQYKYIIGSENIEDKVKLMNNVTANMGMTAVDELKICDKTDNDDCVKMRVEDNTLKIIPDTVSKIQVGDNMLFHNTEGEKRVYMKDLFIYSGDDSINKAPDAPDREKEQITTSQNNTVYVIGLQGYYSLSAQEQSALKNSMRSKLTVLPQSVVKELHGKVETTENKLVVQDKVYVVYPFSKIYKPVLSTSSEFDNRDMSVPTVTLSDKTFGVMEVAPPSPTA